MTEPQPAAPPGRTETREIIELRRLREEQPDLASAVDLQIELLQLQRRVLSRVPLPSIKLDTDYLNGLLATGPNDSRVRKAGASRISPSASMP